MNCLKCGKEAGEKQVFCNACLEVMQAYPVKPDTAVHIPNRQASINEKRGARKQELSPEILVRRQRGIIRWLLLIILSLALLLAGFILFVFVRSLRPGGLI